MPKVFKLSLSAEQVKELSRIRNRHAKAYVRERAAAILKVHQGQSIRQVALTGLLHKRHVHTVKEWISRYQAGGVAGLQVKPGRGRKAVFSPSEPNGGRPSG